MILTDYLVGEWVSLSRVFRQRNDSTNAMASSRTDVIHCQNPRFPWMVVSREWHTTAEAATMANQISDSGFDNGPVYTSSVLHEQTDSPASCTDNPAGEMPKITLGIVIDHVVADGSTWNVPRLSHSESIPELADDVFSVEVVA